MQCSICHKPIVLIPSAAERAAKDVTSKSASYYVGLFRTHAECELRERSASFKAPPTRETMFEQVELYDLRQKLLRHFGYPASHMEKYIQQVNGMSRDQLIKELEPQPTHA